LIEHGPRRSDPSSAELAPPGTPGHPLGTDAYGRDVFARLVHGARTTVLVGVAAAALLVGLGVGLGAIAGVAGGVIDGIVARAVEALTAIPSLVLALVVGGLYPSSAALFWTLALTRWTEVARVVRAEVISTARTDYALAARALGASPARVLLTHILPSAFSSALVAAAFAVASFIATETSIDFLLGLRAASNAAPSWAEMMAEARSHPGAWWLVVLPAGSLLMLLMSFHLVGDAARAAFDPTLARQDDGDTGRGSEKGWLARRTN
jgi:peptide/nickel transport system permease protein